MHAPPLRSTTVAVHHGCSAPPLQCTIFFRRALGTNMHLVGCDLVSTGEKTHFFGMWQQTTLISLFFLLRTLWDGKIYRLAW